MTSNLDELTKLLDAVSRGDQEARKACFAALYRELKGLAHDAIRQEPPGHILQTTALVHETFVRLMKSGRLLFKDRAHFFTLSARAMRRILVDEARSRRTTRRGGGRNPSSLDAVHDLQADAPGGADPNLDLEALDQALDRLGDNPQTERMVTVVELRFFAGQTLEETATSLGISLATVKRDWEAARERLRQLLLTPGEDG